MKLGIASLRVVALLGCFAALASCGDDGERNVGSVAQALPDPPSKPIYPPDVILPTEAVGYLPGSGKVSASGQAGYSIPLDVPPGRVGMQPLLSLEYGSGRENNLLGVGWGIAGLEVIARCKKTLASDGKVDGIDWDDTDTFCLNGQKLVGGTYDPIDNTQVYRTQQESFTEVRAHLTGGSAGSPSRFVARARNGRVLTFIPKLAESVEVDPLDPNIVTRTTKAVVWPVEDVSDRSGNIVRYHYDVTSQPNAPYSFSYLPSRINYTLSKTSPTTPAEREVVFEYEDRLGLDQPFTYSAGVRTVLTRRLASIAMYAPAKPGAPRSLAWRYRFTYAYSDSTFRVLLKSVKQCDPLDKCKWAKEFTWSSEQDAGDLTQLGLSSTVVDESVQTNLGGPTFGFAQPPGGILNDAALEGDVPPGGFVATLVGDFDHDGRDDVLYWDDYKVVEDFDGGLFGTLYWHLKLRRWSSSGPLTDETEVGTAHKAVADPDAGNQPAPFPFIGPNLGASRVIDVDGDGEQELYLARQPSNQSQLQYALHEWDEATKSFVAIGPWETKKDVNFTDLDGDGRMDMVESINDHWHYRLNLGGSFADPPVDTTAVDWGDDGDENPDDSCYGSPVAGDFNGDGRGDILVARGEIVGQYPNLDLSCTTQSLISLDDASPPGVQKTTVDFSELIPGGQWASKHASRLADVNGDGLEDVVSNAAVRFNTGRGFLPLVGDPSAPFHRAAPIDLNGDGRADLVTREDTGSYVAFSMVGNATENTYFNVALGDTGVAKTGDFDGDGAPEFLALADDPYHPTGPGDAETYKRQMYLRQPNIQTDLDLLTEVKDEAASHPREQFTYSRDWNSAPTAQTCSYPQNCIRRGMTVVREHRVSQGEKLLPAAQRTLYTYDQPRRDVRGRGFLGFAKVTELLDGVFRQRTTEYDNAETLFFANQEVYPLKTKSVVEITPILEQPATTPGTSPTSANARIVRYLPTMALVAPTPNSYLVRLAGWSSIETEATVSISPSGVTIPGLQSVKRQRSGTISYDPWSNPDYTETKTVGGVSSTRRSHYLNDGATWLIGQLDTTADMVWDANDAVPPARTIDRDYDAAGRLYRVTREPSAILANPTDSRWQQVELEYDVRGLVTKSTQKVKTGEADRVQYLFYDDEALFVEQTYNPAGHWNTQVFHPALGVPAVTQDPNGLIDKFQYDAFGRVRSATPAGAMKVDRSYTAYQPVVGVNAGVTIEDTGADGSAATTTTDELGRTFEERHRAFDGTWAVNDVAYNVFGAATSVSRPGAGTPSTYRAQTVYDTLGRLVRTVAPDGATSTVIHTTTSSGLVASSTDPDGRQRTLRFDLDDRIITKEDKLNAHVGGTVFTQYTYQPFNLPEFVYDHLNHKTAIGFDALGRRKSLVDPDVGPSSYRYNGFDELKTETDGLGQTRTYYYDVLGRVQTILDGDGGRHFAWDTAANGKGKLGRTESPDQVIVDFTYDTFSRPETQSTTFGFGSTAESFVFKLLYDKHGRPEFLTYPEAKGRLEFVVRNIYNPYGYLQSRVDKFDEKLVYWAAAARELDGSLKTQKQENLVTNIAHDGSTGRIANIEALRSDTNEPLLQLGYGYYPSGDLNTRTEKISGRNEEFVYDGLERLATWTLSSSANDFPKRTTAYNYDALGNLTTVKVDGSTTDTAVFTDPRPHAITSLNGQGFKYDARGRQIEGPKRLVTYNAFDLPKKVTDTATLKDTTYEYDADENRVRRTDPSGAVTTYIDDLYERRQETTATQHVFMVAGEGGVAAQVVYREGSGDTRYSIVADLHGSVNLVVDSKLNVIERRYADPWGTRTDKGGKPIATASSPITKGFTGHEEEAGLALINMRGRIYDPAQRRFLTPDPLVPEPLFSQSHNRYSYVTNNPLRYTDPTGFEQVQTTNDPFTPPEDMCGGNWRIKSIGHPVGESHLVTWKWVPDESPDTAGPGASDDARPPTETELARRGENSKQQLERDARDPTGSTRGPAAGFVGPEANQKYAGFAAGVANGLVPGGAQVQQVASQLGLLATPSPSFAVGFAVGQIVGGALQFAEGLGAGGAGIGITAGTGGVGVVAGVPLLAGAGVAIAGGVGNMAQGAANLTQALSTGGRAAGGPKEPRVYNGKAEALPKDFTATGTTTRNPVRNAEKLEQLRKIENGRWVKVYKDGLQAGNRVSAHYFQSASGKIVDPKIVPGWSNQ